MRLCRKSVGISTVLLLVVSCAQRDGELEAAIEEAAAPPANLVEVTARDYSFQFGDQIPSGWTTFRFTNEGQEPHFFLLSRLPEGKTVLDYQREVVTVFERAWRELQTGLSKPDAGAMIGANLPEWFGGVIPASGVGMLTPGESGNITVELGAGNYIMECYVKTADNRFHVSLGMIRGFTVTEEASTLEPPEADIQIALSNGSIDVSGDVGAGSHVVAVRFDEHPEHGLGNDVHLAMLEEGTDLETVSAWMDWMNIEGMKSPAPVRFLGGAEEAPIGSTVYFGVDLEPGRYAWLTEPGVPAAAEFTVASH